MNELFHKSLSTSTKEIFDTMLGSKIDQTEEFTASSYTDFKGIIVTISFNGDSKGISFLHLPLDTGKKIVRKMNDEELSIEDEYFVDTLKELCNRIIGKTVSKINTDGVKLEITPPIFLIGDKVKMYFQDKTMYHANLTSDFGNFVIGVSIES